MTARTPESQRAARLRARLRQVETPEHVHGTLYGYNAYGCRCERCEDAKARQREKYKVREALMRECFNVVHDAEFLPGMDHPAMSYIEVQVPRGLYDAVRTYHRSREQ